jgi:hypothetical protein
MPENSRRTFAKTAIIGVTGLGLVTFYKGCPDQSTQVWNLAKENLWYLFEREKRAVMAYGRQLLAKEIKERIGYVPLQVALTTFHLTRLVVTTFAAVVTGLAAGVLEGLAVVLEKAASVATMARVDASLIVVAKDFASASAKNIDLFRKAISKQAQADMTTLSDALHNLPQKVEEVLSSEITKPQVSRLTSEEYDEALKKGKKEFARELTKNSVLTRSEALSSVGLTFSLVNGFLGPVWKLMPNPKATTTRLIEVMDTLQSYSGQIGVDPENFSAARKLISTFQSKAEIYEKMMLSIARADLDASQKSASYFVTLISEDDESSRKSL